MSDPLELIELLATTEMFCGLAQPQLRAIALSARGMLYAAEQVIFSRGDPGSDMHVVAEGRVRLSVLNPEGRVLAFNNAVRGDVFGEIAALDDGVRSADATAMTATRTYAIPASTVLNVCTTASPRPNSPICSAQAGRRPTSPFLLLPRPRPSAGARASIPATCRPCANSRVRIDARQGRAAEVVGRVISQ